MIENLYYLLDKSVYYALIVSIFISLCAGLLGVILVLKRYSMMGDGLSHVAFGAYAVATVLSFSDNMLLTIPITIIIAILLLRVKSDGKIKGETLIAMLSAGALAVGYVVMNVAGGNNISGDICTTLFGGSAILCLTIKDVLVSCVLALIVVVVFLLFYNRFFAIVFDETFTKASGLKVEVYKIILAIITAVVIVLSMELVGALLISALIVFPALSSMNIFSSFKCVIIGSACVSVISAIIGLLSACIFNAPIGAVVVIVNIVIFLITLVIKLCLGKLKIR